MAVNKNRPDHAAITHRSPVGLATAFGLWKARRLARAGQELKARELRPEIRQAPGRPGSPSRP